jgi:hypothetical protein
MLNITIKYLIDEKNHLLYNDHDANDDDNDEYF